MQVHILSLITPGFALLFCVLFAVLWWRERAKRHILAHSIGFGLLVVSFAIVIAMFDGKDPMLAIFVHWIAGLGAVAIVWGAATRLGQESPVLAYAAILGLSSVTVWFGAAWGEPMVLMMAQNGSTSIIFAFGSLILWQARSGQFLDRALIWLMAAFSAHGLSRPLQAMLLEGRVHELAFSGSAIQSINVLLVGMFSVSMAMVMLANIVLDQTQEHREEATLDPLSSLSLRGAFEPEAKARLARAAATGQPMAMIVTDIDHFKRINDAWGHATGDKAIASFGQLIRDSIRPRDIAGRIGGEEFCILASGCDGAGANALAERIRSGLMGPKLHRENEAVPFTASFGIAQWRRGETYSSLFERADAALYAAKKAGRNRVFYSADARRGSLEGYRSAAI